MAIDEQKVEEMIALMRERYPDWSDFGDPRLLKDETEAKRTTVEKALEWLSESELRRLIEEGEFEEMCARLDKVGRSSFLLWTKVPRDGDLNILYQPSLDRVLFCDRILDLLYGAGQSHERLERYVVYVEDRQLPNKWTFPTFFLFACHPESEMFVKPVRMAWLLNLLSLGQYWTQQPTGDAYRAIVDACQQIRGMLAPFAAGDMVDVQNLLFVAYESSARTRYWKIAPGEGAYNWEACRDGGFIAIGWDQLGDLSEVSRAEFNSRRDGLVAQYDDWTKVGTEQVWKFAKHVAEGDRVVANHGISRVLGIGTVTGSYYFVPDVRHGHRLPVDWDDLTVREVSEGGWRRTLVELDGAKFEEIVKAPPVSPKLAEPFSSIFVDREEADWAFDLLADALQRFGVTGPDDERFALTFRHNSQMLRLDFGGWAVMHFAAPAYSPYRVGVALVDELVEFEEEHGEWGPFANSDPLIRVYELPIDLARPMQDKVREAYEEALAQIGERFRNWAASNMRRFNQPEVAEAVFDMQKRDGLLAEGLREPPPVVVDPECPFSEMTFDLLERLHETPTYEFYNAEKDALRQHVMEPFKQLMLAVGQLLPAAVKAKMETEKRVFGSILKQFVKHGCWDYYWGAFYPKGGKRTEDAQLFLLIDRDHLGYGFYIGEYGSEQRTRFLRNCREGYPVLVRALSAQLADAGILFGERADSVGGSRPDEQRSSLESWLEDPSAAGILAAVSLTPEAVLQCSQTQLAEDIADLFETLFPLVLLAAEDQPLPSIGRYLGTSETPELKPEYPLAECARETHFDEKDLARWVRAIERKKQAIIYGPPGTGKTYLAEKLAKHLVGGGDGFMELVQFHPSYAYEDFIQGIRPRARPDGGLGYPLLPGRFLDFCERALGCEGRCVLVIDEINRANLSRVFGELMYLLEYRDREVPLAAGGTFSIPGNVRIIGTMNTADRSIALVDHALRRRFAFLALYPSFEVLRRYHENSDFPVEKLIGLLKRLNSEIGDRHYHVGITYFLRQDLGDHIADIWRMEVEPYLDEYFFDRQDKADRFRWEQIEKDIL